jgi:hypothetical protein
VYYEIIIKKVDWHGAPILASQIRVDAISADSQTSIDGLRLAADHLIKNFRKQTETVPEPVQFITIHKHQIRNKDGNELL